MYQELGSPRPRDKNLGNKGRATLIWKCPKFVKNIGTTFARLVSREPQMGTKFYATVVLTGLKTAFCDVLMVGNRSRGNTSLIALIVRTIMPAVPPPAKVLVTGASGFIAAWVVRTLLERGYTVVGTVRSESKGEYLQRLFAEQGDKFSFVIVPDIGQPGALDEVVKDVDAVEHTASPVSFTADDPQELIIPAVQGTTGVLESIKKNNPGIKRVVITSSAASILHDKGGPSTYDESDWNTESPGIVAKEGKNAAGIHKYRASKVLAERSAWEFLEKNKDSVSFDLVMVNPSLMLHTKITAKDIPEEQLALGAGNYVDVRDVALVHVLGLGKENAAGQRYITSAGNFTWQDLLDSIHASGDHPEVPKGNPGSGKSTKQNLLLSHKSEREFGVKFRTLEEIGPVTYQSLKERGF